MHPSPWKLVVYGLVLILGVLIATPTFLAPAQLDAWPDWLPKKQVPLGLDLKGGAHLVLEIDGSALAPGKLDEAMNQSLEIVRRRIDAYGVADPTVQRLGNDRILVQLPGVQDSATVRKLLGSTAKLTFHRVAERSGPGRVEIPGSAGTRYIIEAHPMLDGERLESARAAIDQRTGQPVVSFSFDAVGAKQFAAITKEQVGRPFAIVLDGAVISAPVIQEPIVGGSGQIQGNFTTAEASTLAALLRAGALPAPMSIAHEGVVGSDVGSDAIRMGTITGIAGFLLVLGFMTVLYGGWGLVANLALALNVALTLAALALFDIVLTLPGIAGIVLGLGLAVDANVLINERIREETRNGKNARAALETGFKRAYATILDSNATTLIATGLLFGIGSGPVQGFAATMGIGIAISMFTAVAVVRAAMGLWVRYARPAQFRVTSLLPLSWTSRTPNFKFMRARFVGIGLSAALSIASIALAFKPGLDLGVDFTGGVMIEARTGIDPPLATLRKNLEQVAAGAVSVQQIGDTSVLVRIEAPATADGAAQVEATEHAKSAIEQAVPGVSFGTASTIGGKLSAELRDTGILAVMFASIAMFLYIWMRFDLGFAAGAIVTLVLDVTKTVGFFALTGLEFNLTAIAALLTLIGYSVNDKVVLYDRIRENRQREPGKPLMEVIDSSINETLARSLYTSSTALLAMIPMALWGGLTVQSFAVPMVFGIVVAASSSVFIAAPILLLIEQRRRPLSSTRSENA